jgi:hypothetical protein
MIFIYSGLFSAEKDNHPIPSFYEKITGETSASSGLSRSFSEIVRGRFESAREYNENGIPVFLFFFIQFFLRLFVIFILQKNIMALNRLILLDSIIAVMMLIICFKGLILTTIHNL